MNELPQWLPYRTRSHWLSKPPGVPTSTEEKASLLVVTTTATSKNTKTFVHLVVCTYVLRTAGHGSLPTAESAERDVKPSQRYSSVCDGIR